MIADSLIPNDQEVHTLDGRGADLLISAEREFAAFHRSVTTLYGPLEAQLALEDWLSELENAAIWQNLQAPDWREFTVAASSRLADRMGARLTSPFDGQSGAFVAVNGFKDSVTSVSNSSTSEPSHQPRFTSSRMISSATSCGRAAR